MTLKEWMAMANFTDADVAERLGIERSYVTKLRNRQSEPSLGLAARIRALSRGAVSYEEQHREAAE